MSTTPPPTAKRKTPFPHPPSTNPKRPRTNGPNASSRTRRDPFNSPTTTATNTSTSLNPLKSRLRSLRRLLSSPASASIPAGVRQEHEREISNLEREIADVTAERARNKMIGRYHKVRFFERRKADRRVRKLKREVRADGVGEEEREGLQEKLRDAEVDLNYTLFYPLDVAYVSLFASTAAKTEEIGKNTDVGAESELDESEDPAPETETKLSVPAPDTAPKPKMWHTVSSLMSDPSNPTSDSSDRDLQALRDGKLAHLYADDTNTAVPNVHVAKTGPKSKTKKAKSHALKSIPVKTDVSTTDEATRMQQGLPDGGSKQKQMPHEKQQRDTLWKSPIAEPKNRRERRRLQRGGVGKGGVKPFSKRPEEAERTEVADDDDDDSQTGAGFFE